MNAQRISIRHPNGLEINISAPDGYQDDFWQKKLLKESILSLIAAYGDFNSSMVEGGDIPEIWNGLLDIRNAVDEAWDELPACS